MTSRAASTYRTADLGEPLAVHRFTLGTQLRVIAFFFLAAPITLGVLGATGVMPWGHDWGPMAYVGTALMFAGMPGLGIWMWLLARKRDRDVVRIYERGLGHVDHGKERFIAWADVESLTSDVKQQVRNGVPGPVTHRYELATAGGKASFTHGFERIEQLAEELRRRTAEVIEPRVQEELLAKKTVPFGPLSLSLKGVTHGGKTLHWRDAELRVDDGELVVDRPDGKPFCKVLVSHVPNAHVLAALVTRMRARALGVAGPADP